ncbi:cupin domain-containing protein [Chelatococcus sp.]|uniref:cupin domain-containing protein n=1 Tax=Chelatococcus sp. TaxID=1953771 RepID=UPI00342EEFCB
MRYEASKVTPIPALASNSAALDRETDISVGDRIRQLRLARGRSLKEVAERAGLSIALISQIERGLSSASVRVLARLAYGLDVDIADLFEPPFDEGDSERPIARVKDRKRIELAQTGITKELLTPFRRTPRLDIYMMTIEPNGKSGDESFVHEGEEAGVILEGSLDFFVDGRRYVLGQGDCFRFASQRPHKYYNAGPIPTKVMWVLFRSDEK